MLDTAITEFLENKKQVFLKKKIKAKTTQEEKASIIQDCNNRYELNNWISLMCDVANDYFTTHPCKFIHSTPLSKQSKFKAKDLNIVANKDFSSDGLLKTGNVQVDMDLSGYPDNGNSTELFNFINLKLSDSKTIIEHLKENSNYIKEQLALKNINYKTIKNSFLPVEKNSQVTSERLKQIYFPVGDDYHLLSILIPSGIIYKLKDKINQLRFLDENTILREELKKSSPNQMTGKINEIYGLTSIGYGGTNAQNVSVLNNQNGGVSYLLSSMPPKLSKRKVQPPKIDFFSDCLWDSLFEQDFNDFHQVLVHRKNNITIRDKRDDIVINSITKVKRLVEQIRSNGFWSDSETYINLAQWQKIWLDEKYATIREDKKHNHDYQTKAQSYFANWFIGHYKQVIKKNKLLGDDDIDHIKEILKQEQELLK